MLTLLPFLLGCSGGAPTEPADPVPAVDPEVQKGQAPLGCPEGTTPTDNTTGSGTERYCDKSGVMQGPYLRLFPDGKRAAKGAYDNSAPDGDWVWWHENGQESQKGKYVKGRQVGGWTRWYPNGTKEEEGDYLSGRKAGQWVKYFETGHKMESGIYHNDMKNGLWTYFLDDEENRVERTELWEGGVMKEEKIINAKPADPNDPKGEKAKGKAKNP